MSATDERQRQSAPSVALPQPPELTRFILSSMKYSSPILFIYAITFIALGVLLASGGHITTVDLFVFGALMTGAAGISIFLGRWSARTPGTDFVHAWHIVMLLTFLFIAVPVAVYLVLQMETMMGRFSFGFISLLPIASILFFLHFRYVAAIAEVAEGFQAGGEIGSVAFLDLVKGWASGIMCRFSQSLPPVPTPQTEQAATVASNASGKVKIWLSNMAHTYLRPQMQSMTRSEEKLLLDSMSDASDDLV